jgi:hypothetical protein
MKRPFELFLLLLLMSLLSINALFGGAAMILFPGGSKLGLQPDGISVEISAGYKTAGWMIGNPYLDHKASVRLGVRYVLDAK